ncbi:MAG: YIP1 family protein [Nitrososphaeria archaeon]|jgi:hypothetical protein
MSNSTATEEPHKRRKNATIHQILEIFYAPQRAFKDIVGEPKYIGPILIMVLFLAASTVYSSAILSRSYLEYTLPNSNPSIGQVDVWTENATLWTSAPGATIKEDFNDFINGSYYGNRSIAFSMPNSSQIFMNLIDIGPVNCSATDGYRNLSLRVKIISPKTAPSNASIYLFSGNNSDYSFYDLTETLSNSTAGVWNNLTVPLATEGWANNSVDWTRITGMKLQFGWSENSNITILLDGLYFRGVFQNPLNTDAADYLLNYLLSGLLQFLFRWLLIAGIIFLLVKTFGAKTLWKTIFISVGFSLIIFSVMYLVNTIFVLLTLPKLYYSLEYLGGTPTEMAAATAKIDSQATLFSTISGYVQVTALVWITALCAIATRLSTGFSWAKSATASAIALFVEFIIGLLLGI